LEFGAWKVTPRSIKVTTHNYDYRKPYLFSAWRVIEDIETGVHGKIAGDLKSGC
jgi:hypothetical protein